MEALMRRIHLERWAGHIQAPRNPRTPCYDAARIAQRNISARGYQVQQQWAQRRAYTVSARRASEVQEVQEVDVEAAPVKAVGPKKRSGKIGRAAEGEYARRFDDDLSAPSHRRALQSGKLAALHARLSLPSKLPLQTLARCLIDSSVDPRPGYNNAPFALLGQDLLGYYTSEHLLCHYPRLPMPVLFAAQYAFAGPATLGALRAEWGVEVVAAPGQEVDPGLLQLKRVAPGNALSEDGMTLKKDMPSLRRLGTGRRNEESNYRRGMSSRIVYDDQFGDLQTGLPDPDTKPYPGAPMTSRREEHNTDEVAKQDAQTQLPADGITVEAASTSFVRALAGALHLHAGPAASKAFHAEHVLSRHLQLHQLFAFTHPTRDLSRLCLRENFEPPVARLVSETGRHSRSPVFVVGVYSGEDKLGEGAGSSLNEARVRAAAAALRSWYLYSPTPDDIVLPSDMELADVKAKKTWKPQMVDVGEIIT
jgi:dsRNA-specific ribonuclease